jgi:NAD(P)-dependent dehydrogenase (short-subunit alcohol dehydrogenase family)
MELKDTVALMTGAGSGMGAETARVLAKAGARVILMDRDEAPISKLAAELKAYAIACDVTDEAGVEAAFVRLKAEWGMPRILVNCAGIVAGQKVVSQKGVMPLAKFKHVIDVNLIGSFNVLRCAAGGMAEMPAVPQTEERGVIINVASVAAFEGQIGQAAYSASKGGIVAMTLPLAREFAPLGIRVMTIAPGLIDTPMMASLPEATQASLREDMIFPKRLGKPHEFAKLVLHIIDNPFLNGEVIRLDGAVRMSSH